MAQYNNPIPVGDGTVTSFLTQYAPVTGNIGTNPAGWTYRSGYVAPFRSFAQQLNNANYNLGPYCRKLDGTSGRIVQDLNTGGIGFAQQCWYDYPRSPLELNYEENKDWWASCQKTKIVVPDLTVDSEPNIVVEVAYASYGAGSPSTIGFFPQVQTFFGRFVNLVSFAVLGGNCGTGSQSGYPTATNNGGIWSDIGSLFNGALGAIGAALNGGDNSPVGAAITPLQSAAVAGSPAAAGGEFDSNNLATTLSNILSDHISKLTNFLDDLSDYALTLSAKNQQERNEAFRQVAGLAGSVPQAADLFINGWFLPNLNLLTDPNGVGSANNPYKWRPADHDQQRYAGYISEFMPLDNTNIPAVTPTNPDTGQSDWGWYLTMLNRGSSDPPYVDSNTNEFAIPENYGFNRGGSVSSTDGFLNSVESVFGQQTANSLGTLLDMSPASPFFIATVIPIVTLELGGKIIKSHKGEPIGVTNLDGYQDTKFEMRITASNLKSGNPELYNNLVSAGIMQPVP